MVTKGDNSAPKGQTLKRRLHLMDSIPCQQTTSTQQRVYPHSFASSVNRKSPFRFHDSQWHDCDETNYQSQQSGTDSICYYGTTTLCIFWYNAMDMARITWREQNCCYAGWLTYRNESPQNAAGMAEWKWVDSCSYCCWCNNCYQSMKMKKVCHNHEDWLAHNWLHQPQFEYWALTLETEPIVLLFVRSLRGADFELYRHTIGQLVPWLFSTEQTTYILCKIASSSFQRYGSAGEHASRCPQGVCW